MKEKLAFQPLPSLAEIAPWRQQYLAELGQPQELFLELKVRRASVVGITLSRQLAGYCLLDHERTLLEYYLGQAVINQDDTIFAALVKELTIVKAYCKSFDHTLLACCAGLQKQTKVVGVLFREYAARQLPEEYQLNVRLAEPPDEPKIAAMNEEVFDHDDEIKEYVQNRQVFLFEKESNLIGFGIFQRVITGQPDFDIGMLVDRPYRRQGYGRYIIRYLADYCQSQGWRPICGCAIENEASRRCLESVGFMGRYRMLEFTF